MSRIQRIRGPQGRAGSHPHARKRVTEGPFGFQVRNAVREAQIGDAATRMLLADPDVLAVDAFPDSFEWFDGLDGRDHLHVPFLLVRRRDGSRTFVDVMRRRALEKDPELGGRRPRILLECLARGAGYEIWTENEAGFHRSAVTALSVAVGSLRTNYLTGTIPATREDDPPRILKGIAMRLGIWDLKCISGAWVGRSKLTGIPMLLLPGLEIDPVTKMVKWNPDHIPAPRVEHTKPSSRRRRTSLRNPCRAPAGA